MSNVQDNERLAENAFVARAEVWPPPARLRNLMLNIAKVSVGEVRCQLDVALDQGYLSEAPFKDFSNQAADIGRLLSGLITYLQAADLTGPNPNPVRRS